MAEHHSAEQKQLGGRMRVIGLIGGMSWESSRLYYEILNREVKARLGGLHSAKIVMVSVDFAPVEACLKAGDWQGIERVLVPAARQLEAAGAECILLCTNTMHQIAAQIAGAVSVPFFHIIDALGKALQADGRRTAGLLGTASTMANQGYQQMLSHHYGVSCLIPEAAEAEEINQIIFSELCVGVISDTSRQRYLEIIGNLHQRGADSIIMGCTEIALLISADDSELPLYDTTTLHATDAVRWALSDTAAEH